MKDIMEKPSTNIKRNDMDLLQKPSTSAWVGMSWDLRISTYRQCCLFLFIAFGALLERLEIEDASIRFRCSCCLPAICFKYHFIKLRFDVKNRYQLKLEYIIVLVWADVLFEMIHLCVVKMLSILIVTRILKIR